MATIESEALARGRRLVQKFIGTATYEKATLNDVFQAIEDWFELNRTNLSTVIDTAAFPTTFTNTQKKRLLAAWLMWKLGKEQE